MNYEEAIVAVNSTFSGGKPSKGLVKLLEDKSCSNLTKEVSTTLESILKIASNYLLLE